MKIHFENRNFKNEIEHKRLIADRVIEQTPLINIFGVMPGHGVEVLINCDALNREATIDMLEMIISEIRVKKATEEN